MMPFIRRRTGFLTVFALVAILALLASGATGVRAEESGFDVTVYKAMCNWETYSREAHLDFAPGTAAGAYDCEDGWEILDVAVQITMDGAAPDQQDAFSAVWNNVPAGVHTLSISSGGEPGYLAIEVGEGDAIAWATFYNLLRVEPPPVGGDGATVWVYKATCDWAGTAPGVALGNDVGTLETAHNCTEGWGVSGVQLLLGGEAPEAEDAYGAVWRNVPNGTITLEVSDAATATDSLTFEVNGEDEIVHWATYYTVAKGEKPVGGSTGQAGSGSGSGATITSLPSAGSGTSSASNGTLFQLLAMAFAAVAFLVRRRTLAR